MPIGKYPFLGKYFLVKSFNSLSKKTRVQDALRLLSSGNYDAVQLFSHAVAVNAGGNTTRIWTRFGYNNVRGLPYQGSEASTDYWYPGLAWAYARRAMEKDRGHFVDVHSSHGGRAKKEKDSGFTAALLLLSGGSESQSHGALDEIVPITRLGYVPGVVWRIDMSDPSHGVVGSSTFRRVRLYNDVFRPRRGYAYG